MLYARSAQLLICFNVYFVFAQEVISGDALLAADAFERLVNSKETAEFDITVEGLVLNSVVLAKSSEQNIFVEHSNETQLGTSSEALADAQSNKKESSSVESSTNTLKQRKNKKKSEEASGGDSELVPEIMETLHNLMKELESLNELNDEEVSIELQETTEATTVGSESNEVAETTEGLEANEVAETTEGLESNEVAETTEGLESNEVAETTEGVEVIQLNQATETTASGGEDTTAVTDAPSAESETDEPESETDAPDEETTESAGAASLGRPTTKKPIKDEPDADRFMLFTRVPPFENRRPPRPKPYKFLTYSYRHPKRKGQKTVTREGKYTVIREGYPEIAYHKTFLKPFNPNSVIVPSNAFENMRKGKGKGGTIYGGSGAWKGMKPTYRMLAVDDPNVIRDGKVTKTKGGRKTRRKSLTV